MNRRRALLLTSTIGFTAGGAVAGASGDLLPVGFGALGALGGWSIAWASGRHVWRFLLAGFLGFLLGLTGALFAILVLFEPQNSFLYVGAVGGGLGGAALGWAWGGRRAVGLLAAGGAVGFGVGFALIETARVLGLAPTEGAIAQAVYGAAIFALAGAVGGVAIGVAAGRLAPAA